MQLPIDDDEIDSVRSLLLRSIAADRDDLRRLNMLSTAYGDHVRGDVASRELAGVRRRIEVAQALLERLDRQGTGGPA